MLEALISTQKLTGKVLVTELRIPGSELDVPSHIKQVTAVADPFSSELTIVENQITLDQFNDAFILLYQMAETYKPGGPLAQVLEGELLQSSTHINPDDIETYGTNLTSLMPETVALVTAFHSFANAVKNNHK